MKKDIGASVGGHFEPELQYTFLPGCKNCGGSHPLARKPTMPEDNCPDCGDPVDKPGETMTEKAVLTNSSPSILFSKACLSLGKAINKLSKRI